MAWLKHDKLLPETKLMVKIFSVQVLEFSDTIIGIFSDLWLKIGTIPFKFSKGKKNVLALMLILRNCYSRKSGHNEK